MNIIFYITDRQETNEKCKIRCHPTIKIKRACYNIILTENVVVIYIILTFELLYFCLCYFEFSI